MRLSCKKLQIGHWCCKTDFSAMAATLGKAHFLGKSDHIILQLESHFQQNLNERKSKCLLCSIMHQRSHVFVFLLLHLASFPRCVAQCPSRTNPSTAGSMLSCIHCSLRWEHTTQISPTPIPWRDQLEYHFPKPPLLTNTGMPNSGGFSALHLS